MKRLFALLVLITVGVAYFFTFRTGNEVGIAESVFESIQQLEIEEDEARESQEKKNTIALKPMPSQKTLGNINHVYQTFNNCGPASLSMILSYFGVYESQQSIGQDLRPFQNSIGDNDDKSVTLDELAEKSEDFGFVPYYRPGGSIEILKLFITYDIPIITRTWLKVDEDIGHYRVVKGFNDSQKFLIQDDSMQGKDLRFTYNEFNELWKKFNYEYLVLVPKSRVQIAEQILGDNLDYTTAWESAVTLSQANLKGDPTDVQARFNLSVALYNVGRYEESIQEFEKVQSSIPKRTLWYQIEPILSYYETGNYDRVFEITNNIFNSGNRAFSELYQVRGDIYLEQGNHELARTEFEKAVLYNDNYEPAQEALKDL